MWGSVQQLTNKMLLAGTLCSCRIPNAKQVFLLVNPPGNPVYLAVFPAPIKYTNDCDDLPGLIHCAVWLNPENRIRKRTPADAEERN